MKNQKLRMLYNHCIGTAESELKFLVDAFVFAKTYQDVLYSPFHSPIFLIGRKGTGKTALLKYLDLKSSQSNIRTLYMKPDDMPLIEGIGDAEEISTIKRKAYQAIVSAIAVKVGSELKGLLNRKDKKLFDKSIKGGIQSHDFIQSSMRALSKFGTTVSKIDFTKLIPSEENTSTGALLNSLEENFKNADNAFLLLLDDVDQVALTQQKQHLNRIWGFLLAAKRLTEELPNIRTIISLRTEIWTLIEHEDSCQRDQIDHIRQLIRKLDLSEETIKEIILRRLRVVADYCGLKTDNTTIFREFFDSPKVILPTSQSDKRYWEDYIAKSSRGRPRDAIQFLGLLAHEAINKEHDRITQDIVNKTAEEYSIQRVDDLTREYSFDCSIVREMVNSFVTVDFILSTEALRDHINNMPTMFNVNIRGNTIHQDSVEEIFKLWKFLHEIGLVNPRIPDRREPKKYRHINYDQEPNFVSISNWNNMQKVAWEIHPAYRSYLLDKKKENRARGGISWTSFFNKNK